MQSERLAKALLAVTAAAVVLVAVAIVLMMVAITRMAIALVVAERVQRGGAALRDN